MGKNKNLAYLLPIRCIFFPLIFVVGAFITRKDIADISNWWSIAASAVNILLILLFTVLTKRNNSNYWELINFRKGQTRAKQIVLISLMILLVGMSGMFIAGAVCYGVIPYAPPMIIAPIPVVLAVLNVLILPVSTAFAEDGLYLGCGVNQIKNKYAAIFIPAFFFALQHSFIPTLFDFKFIIYRFLSFLPLTIILCWYYHKKRDPLPILIGHAIIDVATAMQILATSAIPGFYDKMCSMQ